MVYIIFRPNGGFQHPRGSLALRQPTSGHEDVAGARLQQLRHNTTSCGCGMLIIDVVLVRILRRQHQLLRSVRLAASQVLLALESPAAAVSRRVEAVSLSQPCTSPQ